MIVEHLIGKSQDGYLKQINEAVSDKFPGYSESEVEAFSKAIDSFKTVSVCQFCNSTTSRDISRESTIELGPAHKV
ncbi:MAG TPA: hypothetical protein ENJ13_03205 [Chromatiales bacterium]|nr:hypothetical protein [Chromatiales bacterium]